MRTYAQGSNSECGQGRKNALFRQTLSAAVLVFFSAFLFASNGRAAAADNDFSFAEKLAGKRLPSSVPVSALLERLRDNLKQGSPRSRLVAQLVDAVVMKYRARHSTPTRGKELLEKAKAVCKEVYDKLTGTDPLKAQVADFQNTVTQALNRLWKRVVDDLKDPAEKQRVCREIAAGYARQMERLRKKADALRPKAQASLKAYGKAEDAFYEHNQNGEFVPPRSLMERVNRDYYGYITADKLSIVAQMHMVEAYYKTDPKRREEALKLVAYCKKQVESEDVGSDDIVVMWYWFIIGRSYSLIPDVKNATKAWEEAMNTAPETSDERIRALVVGIQKMIYPAYVKMLMNVKDYDKVVEKIEDGLQQPVLRDLWKSHAGRRLLVDYAQALTLRESAGPRDFTKAIRKLREVVESKAPGALYLGATAMAEVMARAKPHQQPRLNADEWLGVGRGFYYKGDSEYRKYRELRQAKETARAAAQFQEVCKLNGMAVEYYRRAVARARDPRHSTPLVRLSVEPAAWVEMGTAYLHMRRYLEAVISYDTMRRAFRPEVRGKWLPDPKRNRKFYSRKDVKKALADLDEPRKGWLAKAERRLKIAVTNNAVRNGKLEWNQLLMFKFGGGEDKEYNSALIALNAGGRLWINALKARRKARTDKERAAAAKLFEDAVKKHEEARVHLAKVPEKSKYYEKALFRLGTVSVSLHGLYDVKKLLHRPPEKVQALRKKAAADADKYFRAYEKYVAEHKTLVEKIRADRRRRVGELLLMRTRLAAEVKDWSRTVAQGEAWLTWAAKNKDNASSGSAKKIKKYLIMALLELAAKQKFPAAKKTLARVEALVEAFKDEPAYHLRSLGNLNARWYLLLDRTRKEGPKECVGECVDKVVEMQKRYLAEAEKGDESTKPSLHDYDSLVYLLYELGRWKETADAANELLKRFDPKNRNRVLGGENDEDAWKMYYNIIKDTKSGLINIENPRVEERCLQDHRRLLDYMFDTREGNVARMDKKPPPKYDRYARDYAKAIAQVETIRKNYGRLRGMRTDDPEMPFDLAALSKDPVPPGAFGNKKRSILTQVADEADYRRRIVASRDLLAEVAAKAASQCAAAGDDENASRYRKMQKDQLEILSKVMEYGIRQWWKLAKNALADKNYQDAMDNLIKIKENSKRGSINSFKASKAISEIFFAQKQYADAVVYPLYVRDFIGENAPRVKAHWPNLLAFIDECKAQGAPDPTYKTWLARRNGTLKVEDPWAERANTWVDEYMEEIKQVMKTGDKEMLADKLFQRRRRFLEECKQHVTEKFAIDRLMTKTPKNLVPKKMLERFNVLRKLDKKERRYYPLFASNNKKQRKTVQVLRGEIVALRKNLTEMPSFKELKQQLEEAVKKAGATVKNGGEKKEKKNGGNTAVEEKKAPVKGGKKAE